MRDIRLSPRFSTDVRSCGLLQSVNWFLTVRYLLFLRKKKKKQSTLRNNRRKLRSQVTKIFKNKNRKYVDKLFLLPSVGIFSLKSNYYLHDAGAFLTTLMVTDEIPVPWNRDFHGYSMEVFYKACHDPAQFNINIHRILILILSYQICLYFHAWEYLTVTS
jgi:hypothetical protein